MQIDQRRTGAYLKHLHIKMAYVYLLFFVLSQLLEMFGAGTACIVCPINRINYMDTDLLIPTLEHAKPIYARIKDTLSDIQYGRIEHPWAVLID